jgi:hypothetical protein
MASIVEVIIVINGCRGAPIRPRTILRARHYRRCVVSARFTARERARSYRAMLTTSRSRRICIPDNTTLCTSLQQRLMYHHPARSTSTADLPLVLQRTDVARGVNS